MYQCKPVKTVSSSNVSKQNARDISSVSKLVKPLTVSKPVCSTFASKGNICNTSHHVKPLNVSKSMNSCNVRNRNVHIAHSLTHHNQPLSLSKSDYSCAASKLVIFKPTNKSDCEIINNRKVFNSIHESIVVNP